MTEVRAAMGPGIYSAVFHSRPARRVHLPEPQVDSERRELSHRFNDGIDVTLYWHPTLDELTVCVFDQSHGAYFEIRPPRHLALGVYNHPYAYAEFAHVPEEENGLAA